MNLHLNWGDIQLTKNKSFEYQFEGPAFTKGSNDKIEFLVRWNEHQDHAGFRFSFSIKGLFYMNFEIYDHRHWDDDKDDWK